MNVRLKKLQSETTRLIAENGPILASSGTSTQSFKERISSPMNNEIQDAFSPVKEVVQMIAQRKKLENMMSSPMSQTSSISKASNKFSRQANNLGNSGGKEGACSGSGSGNGVVFKKDLLFLSKMNQPESKDQFNKSLAEVLRQRREYQDIIQQERMQLGVSNGFTRSIPKESDSKGTAFRIRPQTPKLNLLSIKNKEEKKQPLRKPHLLEALPAINHKPKQLLDFDDELIVNIEKGGKTEPKKKRRPKEKKEVTEYQQLDIEKQDFFVREDLSDFGSDLEQQIPEEDECAGGLLTNFQEKFEEIIENEEVEDAIELNEKFLAQHLNVKNEDLAKLQKIELRVDTSCHNLQMIGEILSSLEYLKMNDSIIRCFRDIGSSFKFVRILHLARCEIREVQGIQAFEHLEELYLSYNDIDDLFDVGFLEHLSVLDLEGNNVKSLDQLYYLRRCQNLTDLNLKHNPVTKEIAYYQKLQENATKLSTLDDEMIIPSFQSFFERKTEQQKKASIARSLQANDQLQAIIFTQSERQLLTRFVKLGAKEEVCIRWCEDAFQGLEPEPTENELLMSAIKNFTKEKKAQHTQGYDSADEFFGDGTQSLSGTPLKGKQSVFKKRSDVQFQTTNSFFKTTSRSTAISSKESARSVFQNYATSKLGGRDSINDSGVSDLVSNNDRVMQGTPFSILRGKGSSLQSQKSQQQMPQDICSLLNEYQNHISFIQIHIYIINSLNTTTDIQPKIRASFSSLKAVLNSNSVAPTKIPREGEDVPPKPIRKLKVTPISNSKRNQLKLKRDDSTGAEQTSEFNTLS